MVENRFALLKHNTYSLVLVSTRCSAMMRNENEDSISRILEGRENRVHGECTLQNAKILKHFSIESREHKNKNYDKIKMILFWNEEEQTNKQKRIVKLFETKL